MAPFTEVAKMLRGQAFGKTHVPDMDLTGKTCIVTGANTGLGLECVKHLYVLITLLSPQVHF
jgi:retinol dehydrogenase-12